MSALVQIKRHVTQLSGCTACPNMIGPVVTGQPVVSPVMLIGQAPGTKEGPAGKPFAWTAGKTMFGWFAGLGMTEEQFRSRVYMAAVCRCFPGKAPGGGDRVPDADEIARCGKHLAAEVRILKPRLVLPVGKLAIAQLVPSLKAPADKLADIVGTQQRATLGGIEMDMIALPHPSGASTWHRTEPGKTLLARALQLLAKHEAWRSLFDEPARAVVPQARATPGRAASPKGDAKVAQASALPGRAASPKGDAKVDR